MEVHTVRIGKDKEGESMIASKQLSDGIDPPNFHRVRKVRTAQQCLRSAVLPHIEHMLSDPEPEDGLKVEAVAEWVKWAAQEEVLSSTNQFYKVIIAINWSVRLVLPPSLVDPSRLA